MSLLRSSPRELMAVCSRHLEITIHLTLKKKRKENLSRKDVLVRDSNGSQAGPNGYCGTTPYRLA